MKTVFTCSNCDAQFPKWTGRCTQCGKWGTIEQGGAQEEAATPTAKRKEALENVKGAQPMAMAKLEGGDVMRTPTTIGEVDRVLGGGIVPGSLTLLGGDPGIGKSTLVAQIASKIGKETLYVSGEESAPQVKMRFDRMGIAQEKLSFLNEEHVEVVCKTILDTKPALAIVDSIQTMASSSADSEPGSVKQIKAATVRFLEVAKQSGIPIIIIGHVTKGGELGGPKTLEHMVDTVLYLEGDRQQQFRLLRAVKNRFGSTHEIGVFDMQEEGLAEVSDPSKIFIDERSRQSGSCLTVVAEGTRLFVVEVQALVNKTVFGYPVRKSTGFDTNRLNVLLAVLEKRAGVQLGEMDVYVNLVGGTSFKDTAMDAAVCMAIISALSDEPLSTETVAWGEVGLGGELRSPARNGLRAKEAKRFGLTNVIAPKQIKTIQDAIKQVS